MAWEIAAARLIPSWLLNLYRAIRMRPYPQPKIVSLKPTGGGGGSITFSAELVNHGTQHCRVQLEAHAGTESVSCYPAEVDLVPQQLPTTIRIHVPRPQLGDLITEFDQAPTLYSKVLRLDVLLDQRVKASHEWQELIYTPESDLQRHKIQQRKWRIGRGEDTPDDQREEYVAERERKFWRAVNRKPRHRYWDV